MFIIYMFLEKLHHFLPIKIFFEFESCILNTAIYTTDSGGVCGSLKSVKEGLWLVG